MALCPAGHTSTTDDFCDICGMRIADPPAPAPPFTTPLPATAPPASAGVPCPRCGTPRTGQFCETCGFNFAAASPPTFPPTSRPPAVPPAAPPPSSVPTSRPPAATPRPPAAPSRPTSPPASRPPGPAPFAPPPGMPAPPPWTAVVSADRGYYEKVRAATAPDGVDITFPAYCAERRFQLSAPQMRIGRRSKARGLEPEIDLSGPPTDPGISRLHAVLLAAPDGSWAVLDPGSSNGTLVNGYEIVVGEQVPLHEGDRINLGAWTAITVHRG